LTENVFNGHMARLQTLISGQRRFIADASQQLRTPTARQVGLELAEDNCTVLSRGIGLGLTIVRDIAAMHKAVIRLLYGENGNSLKVEVRFPTA
jgi:two-component system, OmpR family, sensor histidine kinase TctE